MILELKKIKSVSASTFFPSICHEVMGLDAMILFFLMLSFRPAFSVSSFILIKRVLSSSHFLPSEWYHLDIWGCWYFSWQSWFHLVVHPAWHLHDVLCMEVKQDDIIQPCHTPFPIRNQSIVPCLVLTVASWPTYRFLRRQIMWSGTPISSNFPQFVVIHTVSL